MNKIKDFNRYGENIIRYTIALFSTVGIISIATMLVLNFTFVYGLIIDKSKLDNITGLSTERLMSNYKGLINYLQNPFIDKLKFEDFKMSKMGELHFYEVKNIFIGLQIISILFIIGLIAWFVLYKFKKRKGQDLIKTLNISSNIIASFFVALVVLYFINFSWAFTMFHKIFFRNDYWIFDAKTDSIINALPEELFMIYGAIILGIIIVVALVIKIIYLRKKCKEKELKN